MYKKPVIPDRDSSLIKKELPPKLEMFYNHILNKGGRSRFLILNNKTAERWTGYTAPTVNKYLKELHRRGRITLSYERGRGRIIEFMEKYLKNRCTVKNERKDTDSVVSRVGFKSYTPIHTLNRFSSMQKKLTDSDVEEFLSKRIKEKQDCESFFVFLSRNNIEILVTKKYPQVDYKKTIEKMKRFYGRFEVKYQKPASFWMQRIDDWFRREYECKVAKRKRKITDIL